MRPWLSPAPSGRIICWVEWNSHSAFVEITSSVGLARTSPSKMRKLRLQELFTRQSHELLIKYRSDTGRVDAPSIPAPNALGNQLYIVLGPCQLDGLVVETCENRPQKGFVYFVVSGNHAPLCAHGSHPRPLVGLYVGLNGTATQRPLKSPAQWAWLEPAPPK